MSPPRPGCSSKDEIVYFTFWPIIAFSFFIATDEILETDSYNKNVTNAVVYGIVLFCTTVVHMFAISTLIISILESYLSFALVENLLCKRNVYLEINSFTCAIFLIVLTFVNTINEYIPLHTPISDYAILLCRMIPWIFSILVLIYQVINLYNMYQVSSIKALPEPVKVKVARAR